MQTGLAVQDLPTAEGWKAELTLGVRVLMASIFIPGEHSLRSLKIWENFC